MHNQNVKNSLILQVQYCWLIKNVEHSCKPKTEGSSTCAKVLSHCGASNCIPSAAVICAKIRGKMYCTALYYIAIYCTARSYILNTVLRISWAENMFGTHSEFLRIFLLEYSWYTESSHSFMLVHWYLLHRDLLHCYMHCCSSDCYEYS